MNTEQDPHMSDPIVARLRAALDEVATAPVPADGASPATAPLPVASMSGRRWLAVAASLVLLGAAVTAIAVNLSHRQSVSPAGSGDPTTTTSEPTPTSTMPYFLATADLAPSEVSSVPGTGGGPQVMAWARNGDLADGLLVMQAWAVESGATVATVADATGRVIDGTTLQFNSHGLTAAEREALVAEVTPGSGLPWILPVDGWTMVAMATPDDGATQFQSFGDTVSLSSGPMNVTLLAEFASTDTITKVAVAGQPGWQLLAPNGITVVLWRDPIGGQWSSLSIPPALADRVDGLIAAIVPTSPDDGAPSASAVPAPTAWTAEVALDTAVSSYALPTYGAGGNSIDPAVGQPIPTIRLVDGSTLTVDTPTLFVFVTDWCPHCNTELPAIAAAVGDGTLDGVRVVVVATGSDSTRAQWEEWLAEKGWTGDVVFDTSSGERAPGVMAGYFGIPGYPYLVMVNADGTVEGRVVGEHSLDIVVALTRTTS